MTLGAAWSASSSPALSPRQEQVVRRLERQVGPGPAVFFREACGLLAERPLRPSVTHLVGHLLREVESAVRSVLEPTGAGAGARGNKHRAKIEAVLDHLAIPLDDPVAESWLGLAGTDNPDALARWAHRSALDAPRQPDQAFLDVVNRIEIVLDAILERFEAYYFEVFERLDMRLEVGTPTTDHAKSLRNNFPGSYAVSSYFFSRATAAWIIPLKVEGFFEAPPGPRVDEERGTVQFPSWPESEFLVRVAPQSPTEVVDAAVAIPVTQNARVNYNLIKIALACPPVSAARLVPKIVEAIGSRFGVLIPQEAGALAVALCQGGQVNEAMALARALLDRVPTGYRLISGVDAYEYGLILREHIPSLVPVAGVQVLAMLDRALAKVIRSDSERHGDTRNHDTSFIWRPNIESSGGRAETDIRHSLVNAVRDAATSLADAEPDKIAAVVTELESHDATIFQRIALWLLARHAVHEPELTTARLVNPALVADRRIEREYLLLTHAGVASLDTKNVRRLLRIIDAGPQREVAGLAGGDGATKATTPDPESRGRTARWQRDRLAALRPVLPPEWDARYQALVTEYGDAPDPTEALPEPFTVQSFEENPVSIPELSAMPTAVLVNFIQTWQPPTNRWGTPSGASLRGALSSAVQGDAERRSADLGVFIGVPAIYIGAVINGLYQARTNDAVLDWNGVVRLGEWINQQAQEELASRDIDRASREWREPRLDMLRLLMKGLNQETNPIPAELDERVWGIIADSCDDPDPDTDREVKMTGESYGGVTGIALNAARPQAVRAVISYGLRLRRRWPDPDISGVLALLDEHLDPTRDQSRSVRSIYGELFPALVWMAPDWAAAHVEPIFPTDINQRELLDTAWDAYLRGGRITDTAWNLLIDRYSTMVDHINTVYDGRIEESQAAWLGSHLINRLWHGYVDLDNHGGLLRRYYARVTPEIATHLMWSIGTSLKPTPPLDPQVIARLRPFWEFRVSAVRGGADPRELAGFGYWFASGQFEPKWSFAQLLTTLSLAGKMEVETAVLAKMAELATGYLQACLTILERWTSQDLDTWRLTPCLDSIRAIVRLGVAGTRLRSKRPGE